MCECGAGACFVCARSLLVQFPNMILGLRRFDINSDSKFLAAPAKALQLESSNAGVNDKTQTLKTHNSSLENS